MNQRPVIYQIFTRLFGNTNGRKKHDGAIEENGCGKMRDIDVTTLQRIRDLGATHVWYTGIVRHATATDYSPYGIPRQTPMVVKGKAGSPYAITDYYDVDPDLAVDVDRRMEEFEDLVRRTHEAGMKVVMDFVPNHVAREYRSVCKPETTRDLGEDDDTTLHFSTQNNFYYCWGQPLDVTALPQPQEGEPLYQETPAKATGNDRFDNRPGHDDWYETVKLNYGIDYCDAGGRSEHFSPIPDTWGKMTAILMFWASKGVDAFRCDMAEMVPAAFWTWTIDKVKFAYPSIQFIGEVYNPAQYRNYLAAGFDWLYDKVGMYDCLRDVIGGRRPTADITRQWQENDDILHHTLYFLENHDEQRIASDFFAGNPRKAIPALMVCAWLHPNAVMIYAGQEFGEKGMDEEGFSSKDGRTTIFDYWMVDTIRRGYYDRRRLTKEERMLRDTYRTVLRLVNDEPAMREGVFYDLMYVNGHLADRQFAFLRKREDTVVLVVVNFDAEEADCEVMIPRHAFDFLQMRQGTFAANDLMTGETHTIEMKADHACKVHVAGYGGRALVIHN